MENCPSVRVRVWIKFKARFTVAGGEGGGQFSSGAIFLESVEDNVAMTKQILLIIFLFKLFDVFFIINKVIMAKLFLS